jgi:ribonuclease-3
LFRDAFGELGELPNLINPKGELQELLQVKSPIPPRYEQVSVSGPDHSRQFECAAYHGDVELGRGLGRSKKLAESAAALAALERLRRGAVVARGAGETKGQP